MKKIKTFWKMLYSPNWYQGVDSPTMWQRIYSFRIGLKTAWKLSKIINH